MEALKQAGAVGFTDDGIPIKNVQLVLEAMRKSKQLGVPLSFHEEDPDLVGSPGINAGKIAQAMGEFFRQRSESNRDLYCKSGVNYFCPLLEG